MEQKKTDWGHFDIVLGRYIKQAGISKNKLADLANLQKTQLTAYCRNQVQRPDLHVLARICLVLGCELSDILRYVPPKGQVRENPPEKKIRLSAKRPDPAKSYRTAALAREVGVHPNTIRFYENSGLISPAPRAQNGYRLFSVRHLYQIRICRCILGTVWVGRKIRASAMKVLDAVRDWDIDGAMACVKAHMQEIEREYATALETAALLKQWAGGQPIPGSGRHYTRKEAATLIGVTPEVLRNWERNGLITVPRTGAAAVRTYGDREIARLRIIYMLRQTHYSITAIHRSLTLHDLGNTAGAVLALNKPQPDEEIVFISAGDRWLESLSAAADHAEKMMQILLEIEK